MRNLFKSLVFLTSLSACLGLAAQSIPSGYVQTVATVPSLANGQFGAAWTNLSSSPQLALLGCVSTFQQTVNGTLDSNGHFSTLLADTAQICPAPSTWTFTFTFACPKTAPVNGGFMVAVPVTGGGGTEDISTQINAALPTNPCQGGGSGGGPSVQVNGGPNITPTVNFNNTAPAAGVGFQNGLWQYSGANVSLEFPYGSNATLGLLGCDGTTTSCTNGKITSLGSGAPAVYYNVLSYGGKSDLLPPVHNYAQFTFTATSANVHFTPFGSYSYTFTSADVGKQLCVNNNGSAWSPGLPLNSTGLQCAGIVSITDASDFVIDRNALQSLTAFGNWGTDNTPAFNLAALTAATGGGGIVALPSTGNYLLASTGLDANSNSFYTLTGASTTGDYGQSAGGSGGTVVCTPSGGILTAGGCVLSGGTFYKHSATLQTSYSSGGGCSIGWDLQPCGWAVVTVGTNSSGVPSTLNVQYAGYGITSPVTFNVLPLGGDGTVLTPSTAGGGAISVALTTPGNGYAASTNVQFVGYGGTACSTVGSTARPVTLIGHMVINSSGVPSSVAIDTNNTTCTGTPSLVIGPAPCETSPGSHVFTAQCSNQTPIYQNKISTQVVSTLGVGFMGMTGANQTGAYVYTPWDQVTVSNTQPYTFSGTIENETYTGLNLFGYYCLVGTNNANYSVVSNNSWNCAVDNWNAAEDLGMQYYNNSWGGYVSHIVGGNYSQNIDAITEGGGFNNAEEYKFDTVRTVAPQNSITIALDNQFDQNNWRSDLSADSNDFQVSGGICKTPLTGAQQQTGPTWTTPQTANFFCYRGITGWGIVSMARGGRGGGAPLITNLLDKGAFRGTFFGFLSGSQAQNISCEGCTPTTGTGDAYRTATVQEGNVIFDDQSQTDIKNVNYAGGPVSWNLYSVQSEGQPTLTKWWDNGCPSPYCTNNEVYEFPAYANTIDFDQGLTVGLYNPNGYYPGISFYKWFGSSPFFGATIKGDNGGVHFYQANETTSMLDVFTTGITTPYALSALSATLSGLGGSTQCLESVAGLITGTGSSCGSGSGSGTVTHTVGALTQYSMMMGNGAADSAVTNVTTDSSLNNLFIPTKLSIGTGGTATQMQTTATTVASLPAASTVPPTTVGSNTTYTFQQVLDGTTAIDCTTGGGSTIHWCYSNGTIWLAGVSTGFVYPGTITFTTATSDSATVTGVTSSSHCVITPTNATAAASTVIAYVSAVATNSVTVTHVATTASGGTENILCTAN